MDDKVKEFQTRIKALADEIKKHGEEVDDPKCAALCETTSEVMNGLEKAYDHFINKSEKAWQ